MFFALYSIVVDAITIVSPLQGECVSLLNERQYAFMKMSREERANFFDDAQPAKEAEIKRYTTLPKPVRLDWEGEGSPFVVTVTKRGDGKPWFKETVVSNSIDVWNLEIARTYDWEVCGGGKRVKGHFTTKDQAPRLIRVPGVPNIRDIGGRVIGGRRVKQGMIYRSSGLNNNAIPTYYSLDEVKKLHEDGKLCGMGELGARYERMLKRGEALDPKRIHLIKANPTAPGTARLTEQWRAYMRDKLGIKTDIDLRSTIERFGLEHSPLGKDVLFITMKTNYHDYARIYTSGAEDTRQVLKVFFNEANYPIDFHCIGGADRTGTVATLLHGILGLEDDEIWKDYQVTAWQGGINDSKHLRWFSSFIDTIKKRHEGATLAERIQKYVIWLGFTEKDMERFRNFMFEDI
jgi:protein-tyrosine phosphatase